IDKYVNKAIAPKIKAICFRNRCISFTTYYSLWVMPLKKNKNTETAILYCFSVRIMSEVVFF
ncbi:MAG: hypothetical protein RR916_08835, partial [Anaerorhabdus sp.]